MESLKYILPEITVLGMSCLILLISVFYGPRSQRIVYILSQATLIAAAAFSLLQIELPVLSLYDGQYYLDPLGSVLKFTISLIGFLVFLYSRDYVEDRHIPFGEYNTLALLSILGSFVLVSAYNFISLFLGLEILSLPLYAMIALRRQEPQCIEAAMKYFIMGALASGMLLYGLSILYGHTGTLNMGQVAAKLLYDTHLIVGKELAVLGLVFLVAGSVFKLGAVPFHMWVPDVYEGAPTSVTLLIATIPKLAAFGLIIRLLAFMLPSLEVDWQQLLIAISILSMALGNFVAIVQSNIKRMLAYSSIAHMGYMLLGILSAVTQGYGAALFYSITYAIMSAGAFGVIVLLSKAGIEVEKIEDLQGLNRRNPWLALMMLFIMFSMAGIPPTVGFFAKVSVLEALVRADLIWLAALALLFAIVGAYYYLRIVKVMYFDQPKQATTFTLQNKDQVIAISCNGMVVLVLGIFPGALFDICKSVFVMNGM